MKNYYNILEVEPTATLEQIKSQHRFLLHAWHPDKFPSGELKTKAEEKTKDVNEAYSILSDPAKRESYDKTFRSYSPPPAQQSYSQPPQNQSHTQSKQYYDRNTREKPQKLPFVFIRALLVGIGFGCMLFVYNLQISGSFNDAFYKGISSVIIYGFLYSAIVWLWRVVIKKSVKEPFSSASGCVSAIVFLILIILFMLYVGGALNQLINGQISPIVSKQTDKLSTAQIVQTTQNIPLATITNVNSNLCQWFIKTQFLRAERIGGLSEFNEWYQKYGAEGMTSSKPSVIEQFVTILKTYQPYQEQFVFDWHQLGAHPEAREFWVKELSSVQLRVKAFDQMIEGFEQNDIDKYNDGLESFSEAARIGNEAEAAMQVVRSKCVGALTTTEEPVTGTPGLTIGSTKTSPKDGIVLVYVHAGEFLMGSENGYANEKPQHRVYLDAFWIDQTEVTNAMYAKCVAVGVCQPPHQLAPDNGSFYTNNPGYADYPVMFVDWNQARAYCQWADRRLPSEADWEKAARGTDGRTYPWGEGIDCSLANYNGKDGGCVGRTQPVGSYPGGASVYGALDMAGNVWEWVADWAMAYPGGYIDSDAGEKYRVARGGSWGRNGKEARSANRVWGTLDKWGPDLGFRCALSP